MTSSATSTLSKHIQTVSVLTAIPTRVNKRNPYSVSPFLTTQTAVGPTSPSTIPILTTKAYFAGQTWITSTTGQELQDVSSSVHPAPPHTTRNSGFTTRTSTQTPIPPPTGSDNPLVADGNSIEPTKRKQPDTTSSPLHEPMDDELDRCSSVPGFSTATSTTVILATLLPLHLVIICLLVRLLQQRKRTQSGKLHRNFKDFESLLESECNEADPHTSRTQPLALRPQKGSGPCQTQDDSDSNIHTTICRNPCYGEFEAGASSRETEQPVIHIATPKSTGEYIEFSNPIHKDDVERVDTTCRGVPSELDESGRKEPQPDYMPITALATESLYQSLGMGTTEPPIFGSALPAGDTQDYTQPSPVVHINQSGDYETLLLRNDRSTSPPHTEGSSQFAMAMVLPGSRAAPNTTPQGESDYAMPAPQDRPQLELHLP
eukprot:scpid63521/ scgid33540/ 